MTKKLRLFKGSREPDIYNICKEKRPIDINGELMGEDSPDPTYDGGDEDEWLRLKASVIVHEITDDPVEHRIADLILDYGYTEREVAKILNISPARIEWFIRKIEGWKKNGCNTNIKPSERDERIGKCDLLIVDDEPSYRMLLERYFKQQIPGIKIELAKDGGEAYNLALRFRPRIIWTCIRMPLMNGLELIKLIKENADIKNAKIIVFSAYGSKEMKNQAIELGANVFFQKPGNLDDMLATVADFLK